MNSLNNGQLLINWDCGRKYTNLVYSVLTEDRFERKINNILWITLET